MKQGRKLHAEMLSLDEAAMLKRMRALKSSQLASLVHYTEGTPGSSMLELIQGTALIVAAERYLAKARRKQMKKAKEVL